MKNIVKIEKIAKTEKNTLANLWGDDEKEIVNEYWVTTLNIDGEEKTETLPVNQCGIAIASEAEARARFEKMLETYDADKEFDLNADNA